ncbi:Na/Pi symporter [Georgenia sp. 10Sc9-8]|uniref:Na/Pi symporter n=1 Tax=Georgenia halotolerans TaxID=3028317 RepID=A0ABT5U0X2_9MICO|nr:Na/Pi symporter [Georgenia halotolerans]
MTAVMPQARPYVGPAGRAHGAVPERAEPLVTVLPLTGVVAPAEPEVAARPGVPARASSVGRQPEAAAEPTLPARARSVGRWLAVLLLTYLLVSAVGIIGDGFKTATGGHAEELFAFATNPVVGLMVGILATALMQSSSTVTSIIVGLVAGGLPVAIAIPMIMGANIGTTVTNTLVALGFVGERDEFRRAFSAATVHDWFNLLAVAIFLPLEMMTGFLARTTAPLAEAMVGGATVDASGLDFMDAATAPVAAGAEAAAGVLGSAQGVAIIVLGVGLMVVVIRLLGSLLKTLMVGRAKAILQGSIGRGPLTGLGAGTAVTLLVQSSSVTTSLMVPFAGSGAFTLRTIYPFLLGANIGTTVTALLASTVVTGPTAVVALQIALVHLLFNVSGVLVIYGLPVLREVPVLMAERLARSATEHKTLAAAWTGGMFLALPGALIAGSAMV